MEVYDIKYVKVGEKKKIQLLTVDWKKDSDDFSEEKWKRKQIEIANEIIKKTGIKSLFKKLKNPEVDENKEWTAKIHIPK